MFVVEFRTISKLGNVYPTHSARVGAHIATNANDAAAHILKTTQNVEIVGVVSAGAVA